MCTTSRNRFGSVGLPLAGTVLTLAGQDLMSHGEVCSWVLCVITRTRGRCPSKRAVASYSNNPLSRFNLELLLYMVIFGLAGRNLRGTRGVTSEKL